MHIICFSTLMIISQIIVPYSEEKPFFTKIHRLNTVRDFDDIVDWTVGEKPISNTNDERSKVEKKTTASQTKEARSVSAENTETTSSPEVTLMQIDETTPLYLVEESTLLESVSEKRSDESTPSRVEEILATAEISDSSSEVTTKFSLEDSGTMEGISVNRAEKDITSTTADTMLSTTESTDKCISSSDDTSTSFCDDRKNKRSDLIDDHEYVVDEYADESDDLGYRLKKFYRKLRNKTKRKKYIIEPEDIYDPEIETNIGFASELKKFYKSVVDKMNGVKSVQNKCEGIDDYSENYTNDLKELCKHVKGKMKSKKFKKSTLPEENPLAAIENGDEAKNEIHYIFPYRRNIPKCLLNERFAGDHYPIEADNPIIQPVLIKDSSTYIPEASDYYDDYADEAALYEVRWLRHTPRKTPIVRRPLVLENLSRKRRQTDNPEQKYSLLVDKKCDSNEKISSSQQELMTMIRSLKPGFLCRNNLTFLPLLFVPNCNNCPRSSRSVELGDITFRSIEPRRGNLIPSCGRIIKLPNIKIHHVVIVLMTNNSLNFLLPLESPVTASSDSPVRNILFKRNVISNLKQYLQNAFNFIDIRKVLTEDDAFNRKKRCYECKRRRMVIPGVLLYPSYYGSFFPDSSANLQEEPKDASEYYYFTTELKDNRSNKNAEDETEIVTEAEKTSIIISSSDVQVTTTNPIQ